MVWDMDTNKERGTLSVPPNFGHWHVTPDGESLLLDMKDHTILWDVLADRERAKLNSSMSDSTLMTISPDSKTLAFQDADNGITLYAVSTGKPLHTLKGHTGKIHRNRLVYSQNSQLLASGGDDNRVIVWNVADGKQVKSWTLPGPVNSVLFAPDNRHLILNNGNGTAYVLRLG